MSSIPSTETRKVAIPTPRKGDRTGGIQAWHGCMVDSLLPLMPKKTKKMVDGLWSKLCKIANESAKNNVRWYVHLMMSPYFLCPSVKGQGIFLVHHSPPYFSVIKCKKKRSIKFEIFPAKSFRCLSPSFSSKHVAGVMFS